MKQGGWAVVFMMTDNLRVNQNMFKLFHDNQTSLSVSSVVHTVSNSNLTSLHLMYDPTPALMYGTTGSMREIKLSVLSSPILKHQSRQNGMILILFTNRSRLLC